MKTSYLTPYKPHVVWLDFHEETQLLERLW